jgi:hypothetical protein
MYGEKLETGRPRSEHRALGEPRTALTFVPEECRGGQGVLCPVPRKQQELAVFVLRQDLVPQKLLIHMPPPLKCLPLFLFCFVLNCVFTHLCSVVLLMENWQEPVLSLPCASSLVAGAFAHSTLCLAPQPVLFSSGDTTQDFMCSRKLSPLSTHRILRTPSLPCPGTHVFPPECGLAVLTVDVGHCMQPG